MNTLNQKCDTIEHKIESLKISREIPSESYFSIVVPQANNSIRLDQFISTEFPQYSRSFFKRLIEETGKITINNRPENRSGRSLKSGDIVEIVFPKKIEVVPLAKELVNNLGIKIIFQHTDFLIMYKPAGLLVHAPSSFSTEPTVVDWLLANIQEIQKVGYADRPGIVHRLDKDTSGLLIVPLNNYAHGYFGDLFKNRLITKTYYALVRGHPDKIGTIDFPIGRHPTVRNRMAHVQGGRLSTTHYEVATYYKQATLVKVTPTTGRTHQIRVHFAAQGYGLLGDAVYGVASPFIKRQALHAHSVSFLYDDLPFSFSCDLPEDFQQAIVKLAKEPVLT